MAKTGSGEVGKGTEGRMREGQGETEVEGAERENERK